LREEGGRREDAREGDGRSREAERGREREKERKRERERERILRVQDQQFLVSGLSV
jgi:hypothetical protein